MINDKTVNTSRLFSSPIGEALVFSPCNYIVNKRIIILKKMCMNESGSERAYDNIAVGAFENKFSKHHNNITILLEDYSFIH